MPIEIVVHRHPDEFGPDVQALFALAERESTAFSERWYRNFIQTVTQPHDPVRFYVARKDGRAVAALPLLVRPSRWPLHRKAEALGNYYTALYAPAIAPEADAADLAALVRAVRRDHALLASLRVQPMDRESRAYRLLLDALRQAGLLGFEFYCFGNWFLRVPSDWAAYLASLSSKMRSNIKRMDKKLAQDGGTIEIAVGHEGTERALAAFEHVYAASWKQQEPYPQFMPGLIAHAAQGGWLRLGTAWLNGQPIAAQIWLVAHGKADIYKVAYDETFKDYSPGTVLTARLMQHVIEQDHVQEVDYLIGDDPYKKTWMSDRRERWGLIAYNPLSFEGAFGTLREAMGRLVKAARQRMGRPKPAADLKSPA